MSATLFMAKTETRLVALALQIEESDKVIKLLQSKGAAAIRQVKMAEANLKKAQENATNLAQQVAEAKLQRQQKRTEMSVSMQAAN